MFFTRRQIQKDMTIQDTQGISKTLQSEFKRKEVNEEEKQKKAMKTVGDSINHRNSKPTVNPGRCSTVMDPVSATPLNESKFSGEQTTITTSSLNTMGTKKKSADDDGLSRERSWELDVGEWERAANRHDQQELE